MKEKLKTVFDPRIEFSADQRSACIDYYTTTSSAAQEKLNDLIQKICELTEKDLMKWGHNADGLSVVHYDNTEYRLDCNDLYGSFRSRFFTDGRWRHLNQEIAMRLCWAIASQSERHKSGESLAKLDYSKAEAVAREIG